MYKTNNGVPTPQANIAINKSRIKLYGKTSKVPTYYLKKGQEFEIELFNPTKDTIMAKISLNGKPIAQGGLVLKPGIRVFLDRYIDVAKKFKFDTYEVSNTSEVKKAIEDNGDFKVEFYKEQYITSPTVTLGNWNTNHWRDYNGNFTGTSNRGIIGATTNVNYKGLMDSSTNVNYLSNTAAGGTLDMMDMAPLEELSRKKEPRKLSKRRVKAKKSIETGRVEEGSRSDQQLDIVYMNWESYPFHTLEYKMLPVSEKVNTVNDIKVKRYCTSCGSKQKPNFKFCPSCGERV